MVTMEIPPSKTTPAGAGCGSGGSPGLCRCKKIEVAPKLGPEVTEQLKNVVGQTMHGFSTFSSLTVRIWPHFGMVLDGGSNYYFLVCFISFLQ